MTRKELIRWWFAAVLLTIATNLMTCCTKPPRPQTEPRPVHPPLTIVATTLVQNNLDFLYEAIAIRANLEAWFCLHGKRDYKTNVILIYRISPVWVDSADGENIMGRPRGCPDSVTVGTVHFHPGVQADGSGYCELSDIDVITAHHLPYIAAGIVCRENGDKKLILVLRSEFDARYRTIPLDTTRRMRTFTPTYRWRPK